MTEGSWKGAAYAVTIHRGCRSVHSRLRQTRDGQRQSVYERRPAQVRKVNEQKVVDAPHAGAREKEDEEAHGGAGGVTESHPGPERGERGEGRWERGGSHRNQS